MHLNNYKNKKRSTNNKKFIGFPLETLDIKKTLF